MQAYQITSPIRLLKYVIVFKNDCTKSLAISFAEDGIRVNAIAPGWIKTEFSRPGRENPEFNRKVIDRIPSGEWAEAEDLGEPPFSLPRRQRS